MMMKIPQAPIAYLLYCFASHINLHLGSELCTLKDNKDKKAKNPKKSLIKTMQTRQQDQQRMFVHIPKKRNFS